MDFSSYQSPMAIGAATAGLVFAVAILIGIYQGRRTIGTYLTKTGQALFSQIGFFTVVILVFMLISVLESGEFFNVNITHGALFGILGYALALGFDLVSVVCMLARLNAIRMRDESGARLNLLGVVICAAVSAFANAAGSLQGYNPANLDHTPTWMSVVAPWLGLIFPLMIVILSITTDHILDHRAPVKGIDLTKYKDQEQRRVDMLRVKLDTEKDLLTLDRELSSLRVQRERASGQPQREWFFVRWARPVLPPTQQMISEQLGQGLDAARQQLDTQLGQLQTVLTSLNIRLNQLAEQAERQGEALDILREQVSTLTTQSDGIAGHLDTLDNKVDTLAEQMDTTTVQLDTLRSTVHRRVSTLREQASRQQSKTSREVISPSLSTGHPRQMITLDTVRDEGNDLQGTEMGDQADFEGRIRAAQQTLGLGASNRQIARVANCSPTTVAKWLTQQENAGQEQEPA